MGRVISQQLIDEQLAVMTEADIIYKIDEFYALHNDLFMVVRRRNGNKNAHREIQNAIKATGILSKFPFVEGLALSGSLSKNYADENTDIDFFIITKANRLWIARTLMHIFYRFAVLAGKRNWFCMNYYIDETALEIEEKNIFTAIEIVTIDSNTCCQLGGCRGITYQSSSDGSGREIFAGITSHNSASVIGICCSDFLQNTR